MRTPAMDSTFTVRVVVMSSRQCGSPALHQNDITGWIATDITTHRTRERDDMNRITEMSRSPCSGRDNTYNRNTSVQLHVWFITDQSYVHTE